MRKYLIIGILLISQTGFSQQDGFVEINMKLESREKWKFLENVLEGKRIVALGESLHGVKEYNAYKFEIIQYLHEELGFNVIAIEQDLAMNYYGNQNRDQIPDTLFLENVFSPVWHTKNYLKLVDYIKKNPKLKIIGFDINNINSIRNGPIELAIKKPDVINDKKLISQYARLRKLYKNEETYYDGQRDSIMAMNLGWIINELYPNEKIIVSAANGHIARVKMNKYGYMGEIIAREYRDQYYSIGFYHSLGDPVHIFRNVYYENDISSLNENSLQAKFLNYEQSGLFIDLKRLIRNENTEWVDNSVLIQMGKWEHNLNLSKSFDNLIWIKRVTHPNFVIESENHIRK